MATLGLVLAGGRGERLRAGGPKAIAVVGGRTLLERALATLAGVAEDVRVVAPAARALPVREGRWIADAGEGPLAALLAGFAAVPFTRAVVLGVDLPLVPAALYAALRREAGEGAAMAAAHGFAQPLVSVWSPAAVEALARVAGSGERALVRASLAAGVRALDVSALGFDPDVLANVNTPEDRGRVERRLGAAE